MRKLTNKDMLHAARKALADHLELRPITDAERAEAAVAERRKAAKLVAESERMLAEDCLGPRSMEGRATVVRDAGVYRSMAADAESKARAIESASWERTRQELADRVAFYENRC